MWICSNPGHKFGWQKDVPRLQKGSGHWKMKGLAPDLTAVM